MSTTPATSSPADPFSARGRLLAAAEELFYEEGLNSVGIERVIERAGVAKASLYSNFGSKDELIRSYIEVRHEARRARIREKLDEHVTPRKKILAVFDLLGDMFADPGFRGCAFVRARNDSRPDSKARAACDEARQWLHQLFTDLAKDAGAVNPDQLAQQLVLLYDGAAVSAQMDANPNAAANAHDLASRVLAAATRK